MDSQSHGMGKVNAKSCNYLLEMSTYLLNLFKGSSNKTSPSAIMIIEIHITSNGYTLEELTEQVSRLTMSLSSEDSHIFQL